MAPWRTNLASVRHDSVEVFGGTLRLSRAGEPLNMHSVGVIEREPTDLLFARRRREGAVVSSDVLSAEYRLWRISPAVLCTLACAP
jgi:hypothetical protein